MLGLVVAAVVRAEAPLSPAVLPAPPPAAPAASAPPAGPEHVIKYEADKLTLHVTGRPLSDVLAEVAQHTGAELRGGVRTPHDVTVAYDEVALPEALHRLLGDQNFTLTYGEGGKLRAIELLGGPQSTPPPAAIASGVPPATVPMPGPVSPATFFDVMRRSQPVPVSGKLAGSLGKTTASFEELLDASLHQEDPTVRTEAIRAGLGAIDTQPELRAAVLSSVGTMDDATLGTLLRGMAGAQAEDLAQQIATGARAGELRNKAAGVLQQLRSTAQPPD